MIKLLMMTLLMMFLSSCKAPQIRPQILKDIDLEFNRCRMRCYDLMQIKRVDDKNCGDEFRSGNYPVESCDGLSGFDINRVSETIIPWAKDTKEYYTDKCEEKNQ